MAFIQDFFTANYSIVMFSYGLAFFTLGLVTAIGSRRHSRLALARALPWLSGFGFTHAFHEWAHIFVPIQAAFLPAIIVQVLRGLQLLLLAVSFFLLWQFAVCILPVPQHWRRFVRFLPRVVLSTVILVSMGLVLITDMGFSRWLVLSTTLTRYVLGFLGSALAALGLLLQSRDLDTHLQSPPTLHHLKIVSISLALYAVFGGLLVRPGPFFPANTINSALITQFFPVPMAVYRGFLGLMIAYSMLRAMEIFQLEIDRRLGELEAQQVLSLERDRISRDLHDYTLQSVYAAGILLKTLQRTPAERQATSTSLTSSIKYLDSAVEEIRGYIGNLRTTTDTQNLADALRRFKCDRNFAGVVDLVFELDLPDAQPLRPEQIGHLLAIATEALSNAARHADATQVVIGARSLGEELELTVTDNGKGMMPDFVPGFGLRHMKERARLLGGRLDVNSHKGVGTTVQFRMKWEDTYV